MKPTVLLSMVLLGCGFGPLPPATADEDEEEVVVVGEVRREELAAAMPGWVSAAAESEVDEVVARALAAVPAGAVVSVYFGTWCPDSEREVVRLWQALDAAGAIPFTVHWIGIDRDKLEPAGLVAAAGLLYVPTIVVEREGREIGRIVEQSPQAVESDLLALLTGGAHGILTGSRPELLAAAGEGR